MRAQIARELPEGARVFFREPGRKGAWGEVAGPVQWYRRDPHVAHVPLKVEGETRLVHSDWLVKVELASIFGPSQYRPDSPGAA